MRLRIPLLSLLFAAASLSAATDKEIAEKLEKEGIRVKLTDGAATSVLFSDKEMMNFIPTPAQFKLVGQLTKLKSLTVYNNCGATDDNFGFIDKLEDLETVSINALK